MNNLKDQVKNNKKLNLMPKFQCKFILFKQNKIFQFLNSLTFNYIRNVQTYIQTYQQKIYIFLFTYKNSKNLITLTYLFDHYIVLTIQVIQNKKTQIKKWAASRLKPKHSHNNSLNTINRIKFINDNLPLRITLSIKYNLANIHILLLIQDIKSLIINMSNLIIDIFVLWNIKNTIVNITYALNAKSIHKKQEKILNYNINNQNTNHSSPNLVNINTNHQIINKNRCQLLGINYRHITMVFPCHWINIIRIKPHIMMIYKFIISKSIQNKINHYRKVNLHKVHINKNTFIKLFKQILIITIKILKVDQIILILLIFY